MGIAYSGGSESGTPHINRTTCSGCGKCASICPVQCLRLIDGAIAVCNENVFGCISCAHCMMVCPTGSITVTGRGLDRCALRELPKPETQPSAEQLENLLIRRRSVRHFDNREVPRALIERIISASGRAPMGIPPSEVGVTVFHGRSAVRALAWDAIGAYARLLKFLDNRICSFLLRLLNRPLHDRFFTMLIPLGRALLEGKREDRDLALYDAPAALLFHHSPYTDQGDAFIACTYAMLEAEALGLGTTMIGCVPGPLAREKRLLEKYGLLKGHRPALALILGYPATKFQRAIERPIGTVRWIES